jgi:MFS transporter, CP family, cyanate transporter
MKSPRFDVHPSWIIVLAGVSAAMHVGKLPPALPVLQATLGISLVQAGFLMSTVQMAGMALGLIVGLGADYLGLRRCMLVGLAVLSTASFLGGCTDRIATLLFLRGVEGLGFLLVVMPAPTLIRRTVVAESLGPRLGWWGAYMPLGSAMALLVGPWVLAALHWSFWWWLLGLTSALAWAAVWWFVPESAEETPGVQGHRARYEWLQRLRLTVRSPGPWLVSLCFAAYSAQWMAVIGFLPMVYSQKGLAAGIAGLLTAVVALVNVSGNVVSGRLMQHGWSAVTLLRIGFVCMGLGTVGAFGQWQGEGLAFPLRFASVLVFSAVGGLIPGTLFLMAVRLAPSENTVTTTVGAMQQWSALGQFVGPPLVAWVAAGAGGWQWTWTVTVALCLVGCILAGRIGRGIHTFGR